MNKKLFFLAIAALGLAACSNDDVVEINQGESISFRPFVTNMTRAVDANLSSTGFRVTATETSNASKIYFTNVDFTGTTTYTSSTKYYWPSGYNLDFYAYAPIAASVVGSGKQIVPTSDGSTYDEDSYKKFIVTPDGAAASQVDLVYARTNNWGKADGAADEHAIPTDAAGVTINFRHAESKVAIKLYNSNSNIKVYVRDASICNVFESGVFTFNETNTDGQNNALLTNSTWSTTGSEKRFYLQTDASETKYNVAVGDAEQVGEDWILIPQTLTYATTYDNTQDAPYPFSGACIKVNLKILNNSEGGDGDAYIVGSASGTNEGYITALWPLKSTPTAWEMGKRYTYTVDLAGGGYYEKNEVGDDALDPILSGAEIKFVSVTVDNWTEVDGNVYTGATPSTPVAP